MIEAKPELQFPSLIIKLGKCNLGFTQIHVVQKLKLANGVPWKYRNDVTLVPTTVV